MLLKLKQNKPQQNCAYKARKLEYPMKCKQNSMYKPLQTLSSWIFVKYYLV